MFRLHPTGRSLSFRFSFPVLGRQIRWLRIPGSPGKRRHCYALFPPAGNPACQRKHNHRKEHSRNDARKIDRDIGEHGRASVGKKLQPLIWCSCGRP